VRIAEVEADPPQSELGGGWCSPRRDHDLVHFEGRPSGGEHGWAAVDPAHPGVFDACPLHAVDSGADAYLDVQLAEPLGDQLADERLMLGQEGCFGLDHGDFSGAQAPQPRGRFAAHDPAPDHGDSCRHLLEVGDVP